ncbi:MAG: cache domain-containing protein, partial [Methanocella sp.]
MPSHSCACRLARRAGLQMWLYVLPLVAVLSLLTVGRFHDALRRVQDTNLEMAQATAVAFQNYLSQLWQVEEALGNAVVQSSAGPEAASRLLTQQLYTSPSVRDYLFLDPHGRVVAAVNPKAVGTSLADRRFVQELMSGGNSVVSELLIGRFSGEPSVVVGRAIRQRASLRAIVLASIDVTRLAAELPSRAGKANVGLVDSAGRIVYQSQYPYLPFARRQLRPEAPAWQALRGSVGRSDKIVAESDSLLRVGVAVPIPSIGWAATAGVPRGEALIPAYQATGASLLACLLVVGATLMGVLLPQREQRLHSRALSQAAAALAEGQYDVRVEVSAGSELARADAAFNHMAERIQELERERARFIQSAAHELRTPMTTVKAVCELLAGDLKLDPRTDSLAGILKAEVSHLSALVNDILDSFLVREGRLSLDLKPLNLVEAATAALSPFQASEPDRFSLTAPGDPVMVRADLKRLIQVLQNILNNAVKYSGTGTPVEVRVSMDRSAA